MKKLPKIDPVIRLPRRTIRHADGTITSPADIYFKKDNSVPSGPLVPAMRRPKKGTFNNE